MRGDGDENFCRVPPCLYFGCIMARIVAIANACFDSRNITMQYSIAKLIETCGGKLKSIQDNLKWPEVKPSWCRCGLLQGFAVGQYIYCNICRSGTINKPDRERRCGRTREGLWVGGVTGCVLHLNG